MKRLFIAALALASLVSCSKDEVVNVQLSPEISFEQAFVDNATRAAEDPSTTTDGKYALTAFDVWGFIDGNDKAGAVFNQERVTKDGADWTYANTQYWIPNNKYYFAAVSPVDDENVKVTSATELEYLKKGLGTISFNNVDGTTDLIYAANGPIEGKATGNEKVKFVFNHLLSKVKFTFVNGFTNKNANLIVKNIKMTAPGAGTIDLATDKWWEDYTNNTETKKWELDATKTTTLEFKDAHLAQPITAGGQAECDFERLTIPALSTQAYIVTFDVELYMGDVLALSNTLTTTITGTQFRIGYAYNFVAKLDQDNIDENPLEAIKFDVESIKGWYPQDDKEQTTPVEVEIDNFGVASISSEEQLQAAMEQGVSSFRLVNDITTGSLSFSPKTVTDPVVKSETTITISEFVLDLNGKTINPTTGDAIVIDNGAKLTINGNGDVKASENNNSSANAVWVKWGDVIINGGNYYVGKDHNDVRNDLIYVGCSEYKDNASEKKSSATIYGGEFSGAEGSWLLNLRDEFARNESTITVYGGKFKGFNPAAGNTESPAMSFVAKGYGVEVDDEWYVVKQLPALSVSEIKEGETYTLTSNAKFNGILNVNGTLDGNNNTLFVDEVPVSSALIKPITTAVVKNLKINGNNYKTTDNKSTRGFYGFTKNSKSLELDNVHITGTGYTLNVQNATEFNLTVKNSTLEGWTSYNTATIATFINVNFTRGNYFTSSDQNGYFRPYGTTTLTKCSFELGYIVDFGSLGEGKTITFKNCKYNGTVLTAENIPTNWENFAAAYAAGKVKFETTTEE